MSENNRIIGFEGLGNGDKFETKDLEQRLRMSGMHDKHRTRLLICWKDECVGVIEIATDKEGGLGSGSNRKIKATTKSIGNSDSDEFED